MLAGESMFRQTLRQLESGLTVELVAEGNLRQFDHLERVDHARFIMSEHDFSQAPVTRDNEIVGVIDIDDSPAGVVVGEWMRPLAQSAVVSSQTSLREIIKMLAGDQRRYRLVVDANGSWGIVTRSDLQKLPVRLLLFTYVTHLEALMAKVVNENLVEEQWLALLEDVIPELPDQARQALDRNVGSNAIKRLHEAQNSLRKRDSTPTLLELTQFSQKWYIVYRALSLGSQFASEMTGVQWYLRNLVAHNRGYVSDDFQLEQLERRLSICEKWIEYFTDLKTNGSMPGCDDSSQALISATLGGA